MDLARIVVRAGATLVLEPVAATLALPGTARSMRLSSTASRETPPAVEMARSIGWVAVTTTGSRTTTSPSGPNAATS